MGEFWLEPWFWPSALVILGLPLVLLVLTEVHASMTRRGAHGAKLVLLIRNWVAPFGALLLLLAQTRVVTGEFDWVRVTATAFGFLVILTLLNGLNVVVFAKARPGSWRNRIPSIFVDIARVVLIVVSVAILFAVVWQADVGGVFTALGIGSIVIGLALQSAVGPVISGLLLLFEQPFELGDYLLTDQGKGRVVAVNWRATHIDTGNGILVIPNATLSGASFQNLSRATSPYEASDILRFATDDPPQAILEMLVEVASGLPELAPGSTPSAIPVGKAKYEINIPLTHPSKQYSTLGLFRTRVWYAARRADLHLDGDLTDNWATPERKRAALERIAPMLYLAQADVPELLPRVRLERYGRGEVVQRPLIAPDGVRYIISGQAEMAAISPDGRIIRVLDFGRDDALGLTSVTRQGIASSVTAVTDLAVLLIPVDTLDELLKTRSALARDYGRAIDHRRERAMEAFENAGLEAPRRSRTLAY
jgi:small-conductance mechanosensitive channel